MGLNLIKEFAILNDKFLLFSTSQVFSENLSTAQIVILFGS